VGYAGGSTENPTYENLADHIEVFQVDYDPSIITYEDILQIFWENHNPTNKVWSRQYMSAILFENEAQETAALESKEAVKEELQKKIYTEVIALDTFYIAEDYHQKYYLKNRPELLTEIKAYYPKVSDLTDSTVAARMNGIVGGYGDPDLLRDEVDSYGLSKDARNLLEKIVY